MNFAVAMHAKIYLNSFVITKTYAYKIANDFSSVDFLNIYFFKLGTATTVPHFSKAFYNYKKIICTNHPQFSLTKY